MSVFIVKQSAQVRRHNRVRATIKGTSNRPRLSVFRSLKHITAQIIDDEKGTTLVAASDKEITAAKNTKTQMAFEVGKLLAKKAIDKKISTVVFDRGGHRYHGRIKALAEGAREGKLVF